MKNHSPWLAQLRHTRPPTPLLHSIETDVCIVGAGIAGVSTAYFTLKHTDKDVVLIEANKVAHGATGHNAGQITSYFETSFASLVERYGLEDAARAQRAIDEDARVLLESVISEAKLDMPYSQFVGHDGLVKEEQILECLEDLRLMESAGLRARPLMIAQHWKAEHPLPAQYAHLYEVVDHADILSLLESRDPRYIAAKPFISGCMNSALFSEEVVGFLLATYPDRFRLYEYTSANTINLLDDEVEIVVGLHMVTAKKVVLCTNGFEALSIHDKSHGKEIDTSFHHHVEGIVGYMAAYREPLTRAPFAGIYSSIEEKEQGKVSDSIELAEPYFYVTRRPFDIEGDMEKKNLVSIGGPDRRLPAAGFYDSGSEYPEDMEKMVHEFIHKTFHDEPHTFEFLWHGLMGYTKSGVRIIGPEPLSPNLIYNLGCNGVGILTSVYGADRVSKMLRGDTLAPMIFDPWEKVPKTKMFKLRGIWEGLKKKRK